MKAKLIRVIPQREGLPSYFRKYEFECIACGNHYLRGQCNDRIVPYCSECHRKYDRINAKKQKEIRDKKNFNALLDDISIKMAEEITKTNNIDTILGLKKAINIINTYKKE